MFNSRTDFNCLVNASSICSAVASCNILVVGSLATTLVDIRRVLRWFVCSRVGSVLAFSVGMKLRYNLHRITVLSCGGIYLSISSTQFWCEKIALCWPNLWMMPLHLDLVVNTWRDGTSRWISLGRINCMVWWLLVIYRASIVWSCCFWEQVVLIGWSLQVLSVNILLGSWNLNLYIRLSLPIPISNCLCLSTTIYSLLFIWTIEVLLGWIHNLISRWGVTN